jgi:hypothetical protein
LETKEEPVACPSKKQALRGGLELPEVEALAFEVPGKLLWKELLLAQEMDMGMGIEDLKGNQRGESFLHYGPVHVI